MNEELRNIMGAVLFQVGVVCAVKTPFDLGAEITRLNYVLNDLASIKAREIEAEENLRRAKEG